LELKTKDFATIEVSYTNNYFILYSPLITCYQRQKPSMAFGAKGRPSSAGKPRIPSNATILFDIKMVGLPGREEELIDLIGDV
jgi:hypothetical protein